MEHHHFGIKVMKRRNKMSNNYFKNISKKYRIKGKDFTLSSTYYPPYNMKKRVYNFSF